jgi:ferrous iron transport protein A
LPPDGSLPLELVRAGEWAEVADVWGDPSWVGRMAELGIRTGCRLRVLRGGQPCLLDVNGCRLCLRVEADAQILVRPVAAAG